MIKPLKAATIEERVDLVKVVMPIWASPKIDGIRCFFDKQPYTKSRKNIPNIHTRNILNKYKLLLDRYDGELLSGNNFQDTTSNIMTHEGSPDFKYLLFDYIGPGNFKERFINRKHPRISFVQVLEQKLIKTHKELLKFEEWCYDNDYEGMILRRADGGDHYKYGRSTLKEAYIIKFKRFIDSEAIVVGFKQRKHNDNKLEKDNYGYAKRSGKKEGIVLLDTLGGLIVKNDEFDVFNLGTGYTDKQRDEIWANRNSKKSARGKIVKFRYQLSGIKDKPRFLTFLGFRDERDM